MNLYLIALAEMSGTFAVILIGGGSLLVSERMPDFLPGFGVAVTFGVMVSVMILAVGAVSGAHFNPAVTLAFALTKRIPAGIVPLYCLSQCAGGAAAGVILNFLRKL